MGWRIGSKVPMNVYDGDRPVCQAHTAEDAALIVSAVNQCAVSQNKLTARKEEVSMLPRYTVHQGHGFSYPFAQQDIGGEWCRWTEVYAEIDRLKQVLAELKRRNAEDLDILHSAQDRHARQEAKFGSGTNGA